MYEYLTENVKEYLGTELLYELGKQGWYLITIYKDVAYFVRPFQAEQHTLMLAGRVFHQNPTENLTGF